MGSKVMQRENNADLDVYNGDVGRITDLARVGDKQGTACLQYRAPIGQTVAEFIKSHAAGGPRGHDNGSYSWQPLLRHTAAPPYT